MEKRKKLLILFKRNNMTTSNKLKKHPQRIGHHINIIHDFINIPRYASKLGYGIFQIFLGIPQRVISKPKTEEDLLTFGNELRKYDLKMVIHASYTINLCHPTNSIRFNESLRSLIQDLNASALIGNRCIGVIIHMGKNVPANKLTVDQAINNYVNGLILALEATPDITTIILETGASQGSEVGSKIEILSEIYNKIDIKKRSRIKFCIDTCHIWASGYDISNSTKAKKFFKIFDKLIGIDNIVCLHLNDSKTILNSHVDRHADLGYGYIKSDGLKEIVKLAMKYQIAIVMETPLNSVNPKTNKNITFEEELNKVKLWLK